MKKDKKKLYKKYLTGGKFDPTAVAGSIDTLSPLFQKNYRADFLDYSTETKNNQQVDLGRQGIQSNLENLALKSGNPYAMAAGAAIKVGRVGSEAIDKYATNSFGQSKSFGAGAAQVLGEAIDPLGMVTSGFNNLNNDNLSTFDKVIGFTPIGAVLNKNKIAKAEKKEFLGAIGDQQDKDGEERYKMAIANGFNPNGNEFVDNYRYGGKLYKKLGIGGNIESLSSENSEVVGNSHEEGGVKIPELGVELEGGETLSNDFVFSEELGFAQKHKPIAKAIGKIEKKPNTVLTSNTLDRLKEREEQLKVEQEHTKGLLGLTNDLNMKKYGGKLLPSGDEGVTSVMVRSSKRKPAKYEDVKNKAQKILEEKENTPHYNPTPYKSVVGGKKMEDGGSIYKKLLGAGALAGVGSNQPITESQSNVGIGGNLNIGAITPYADNILNFTLNRSRANESIPEQGLTTYLEPVKYDYSAQRSEADTQRRMFNRSIDDSNLSTGVGNSNKAMGLYQTIRAKNLINEGETNINNQEKSNVSRINKSIESNNNAILLANRMRKLGARDDIRREDSMNMANVVEKTGVYGRDRKLDELVRDQNTFNLAATDIRTSYPYLASNPELAKKYKIDLAKMKAQYDEAKRRDAELGIRKYGGKLLKVNY